MDNFTVVKYKTNRKNKKRLDPVADFDNVTIDVDTNVLKRYVTTPTIITSNNNQNLYLLQENIGRKIGYRWV